MSEVLVICESVSQRGTVDDEDRIKRKQSRVSPFIAENVISAEITLDPVCCHISHEAKLNDYGGRNEVRGDTGLSCSTRSRERMVSSSR